MAPTICTCSSEKDAVILSENVRHLDRCAEAPSPDRAYNKAHYAPRLRKSDYYPRVSSLDLSKLFLNFVLISDVKTHSLSEINEPFDTALLKAQCDLTRNGSFVLYESGAIRSRGAGGTCGSKLAGDALFSTKREFHSDPSIADCLESGTANGFA